MATTDTNTSSTGPPGPPSTPVTVVGLGALGTAVAGAFVAAGHPTTVWNRTPGRVAPLVALGARPAVTVSDAVAASPVVLVVVSGYDDVRSALAPATPALAGRTLVNLTSGTPDQARDMAGWAAGRGAAYVDGAAMSGTRLVGDQAALFLYGGLPAAFAAASPALATLGRTLHLGSDPGVTSLYDTALLGLNLGVLAGFYHAVALVGTAGVDAAEAAAVVTDYLPFVTGLLGDHARQVDTGRYSGDDGTLDVLAAAIGHLAETSHGQGIGTDLPDLVGELVARAIAGGHGGDGIARLVDVIATPSRSPSPVAVGR
jgi:3-hydroxyisobutyrate dehydrogenase-like beta-hydroxyacid dehydrogenase